MPLFKEKNKSWVTIKSEPINKEKELQTIIENNLLEIFDMYFLASEYTTTTGGRIDSLAVDTSGCPVIIEYKRNRNDNVINQSLSYLKWLKSQKKEFFERLIQKKLDHTISNQIKIDWENPRVVCIAESFSRFDIDTVEIVPIRIELYKYKFYEDRILNIDPINIQETRKKDINYNETKKTIDNSLENLLQKGNDKIKELFSELKNRIIEIDDDIEQRVTTSYVAYRLSKSFAEIHIESKKLVIYLRPIEYGNTIFSIEKIPDSYLWTLNRRIYLDDTSKIDEAMEIISLSYNDVK
jgi:predicted transport protein